MKYTLLITVAAMLLFQKTTAQNQLTKNEVIDVQTLKRASVQASESWFTNAQKFLQQSSADFKRDKNQFVGYNETQKLAFGTEGKRLSITPADARIFSKSSIDVIAVSKDVNVKTVPEKSTVIHKDNYIRYDYSTFSIEYINGKEGLRQNFIISERPQGNDALAVSLEFSGELRPTVSDSRTLSLLDKNDKTVLKYDDLVVWDANNTKLNAHMQLTDNNAVNIVVDDADAVYPVTIDPLTHAAEWVTSANGLLPALLTDLQLQVDALYGFKVAGLGDINGDGYDDVAISAPGAVDVIAGPVTVAGAGAVFIYFGSPSGLPTTPSRTLRSSTPVANALFGFSVAAGNVTGNVRRDVIVGAPAESYTATVGGLFTTTASVTAGKIYVFNGQTLSGAGPYTSSSVFIDGTVYFNNGLLVLGNNITINALFGYSVAATEDMDGDGLGEIVVGAPGYAAVDLIPVRTGGAFLIKSGNIASNTLTQLNPPALLDFPVLGSLNLSGLLFGFSVDGAGDYNKDGRPDVIVGAPGGLNLGVDGFLGGSAYVYYGTAGGVNTSFNVKLTGGGGLVGSVANLFGYYVKGLGNSTGARNGNIVVSAPVSNVVTNILNGLRLKAGTLNVFIGNTSHAAAETPVQSFSSPRANAALLPTILSGQNLEVSVLFGASADNMMDADCDGFGDLLVGEPLSTGVGLIAANAVGGAAYIFRGKPDGTFETTPYWSLENSVSFDAGINAGSLLGYSVAGIGRISGSGNGVRALVGAPGGALDFSSGVLALGNTLSTTFSFVAGNNGLGKSYTYNFNNCLVVPVKISGFDAVPKNCDAAVSWKTESTEGIVKTVVQQSPDGIHFTNAKEITGTVAVNETYILSLPQKNMVAYYRLQLTESNGNITYSDVKKVRTACGKADVLQAYPTVFNNDVKVIYTVGASKGYSTVTVTDIYGRRLYSRSLDVVTGDNQVIINGAGLAAGVYYVQVSGENYRSETVKIIRQ